MGAVGTSAVEYVSGCDLFGDGAVYNASTQIDYIPRVELFSPNTGIVVRGLDGDVRLCGEEKPSSQTEGADSDRNKVCTASGGTIAGNADSRPPFSPSFHNFTSTSLQRRTRLNEKLQVQSCGASNQNDEKLVRMRQNHLGNNSSR